MAAFDIYPIMIVFVVSFFEGKQLDRLWNGGRASRKVKEEKCKRKCAISEELNKTPITRC
jgi:hypothetical protein